MNKRLEKAIDSIDEQARRFDDLERAVESTLSQIFAVSEKQDRLFSVMESILEAQARIGDALERIDERSTAEMELFLRLSKRVDSLEDMLTPLPGKGNGGC